MTVHSLLLPFPDTVPTQGLDADADAVVQGLLDGITWGTRVFHVGQYCGPWRASTAGRGSASFHLVLGGRCFLHLPQRPVVPLGPGDCVVFLRDQPHFLSPSADPAAAGGPQPLLSLAAAAPAAATGMACGFFEFGGPFGALMTDSFPVPLVMRTHPGRSGTMGALFSLLLAEAHAKAAAPGPLMDRLVELLFFYAIRHAALHEPPAAGLWALLRRPGFAPLLAELLRDPARAWQVEEMAQRVHMSRARFFRQFADACGQSPLQFLLLLRMQAAARRLEQGEAITSVAALVGYRSYAAFCRAFKRVMGRQPGAWQRGHVRQPGLGGDGCDDRA